MIKHVCHCGNEWECPFCETPEASLCPVEYPDDVVAADCPDCITDLIDDMEAATDGDLDDLNW